MYHLRDFFLLLAVLLPNGRSDPLRLLVYVKSSVTIWFMQHQDHLVRQSVFQFVEAGLVFCDLVDLNILVSEVPQRCVAKFALFHFEMDAIFEESFQENSEVDVFPIENLSSLMARLPLSLLRICFVFMLYSLLAEFEEILWLLNKEKVVECVTRIKYCELIVVD